MKQTTVRLRDQQGRTVDVPQADAGQLLDLGYSPTDLKQKVTLAEGGGEVSLGDLVDIRKQYGVTPRLEIAERTFARTGEERFGGTGGTVAGLVYGGAQALTGGLAGKGLIESGLVEPETLAQLQATRPKTVSAGEVAGTLGLVAATRGAGAAPSIARLIAREAAIGGIYGAGSEVTQAAIEGREARPLEAGLIGGTVGGVLGGALGGAGAALERRAAAREAAAVAKVAEEATARQGQAAVIEQAENLSKRMVDTADQYNSFLGSLEDLGVSSPKGIRSKYEAVSRSAERLNLALAKATTEAETINDAINPIRTGMAEHAAQVAKAAQVAAEQYATKTGELVALRAQEAAEKAAGKATGGLTRRIAKLQADASAHEAAKSAIEAQARGLAETAAMVEVEAAGNKAAVSEATKVIDDMTKITGQDARAAAAAGRKNAGTARINAEFEDAALREAGLTPTTDSVANGAMLAAKDGLTEETWRPWLQRVMNIEAGSGRAGSIFGQILGNDSIMTKLPVNAAAAMVRIVDRATAEGAGAGFLKRATALGGNRPEFLRISKNADRIRKLVENTAGPEGKAVMQAAGRDADALIAGARQADPAIAGEAIREFTSIFPKTEARAVAAPLTDEAHKVAVEEAVTATQLAGTIDDTQAVAQSLAEREVKIARRVAKLTRDAEGEGDKALRASAKLAQAKQELEQVSGVRQAVEERVRTARQVADEMRIQGAEKTAASATSRATIADLQQQMVQVQAAARLADASAKVRALTAKQKEATSLAGLLQAKQEELKTLRNGIIALEREGGRFRNVQGRLVPPGQERLTEQQLKAFYKTPEGAKVLEALKGTGVKPESHAALGAVLGSAIVESVLGHGLVGTLLGAFIGAKLGGRGAGKVIPQIMNQLRTTQAVDKAIAGFQKVAPPVGRAATLSSTYSFPVQEAHTFVEDLKRERAAIDDTWRQVQSMPDLNQNAIGEAKRRFDEVASYLDMKRPPAGIVTGANATEFARAVAVIKNPELIQKFIRDGALRPSDVETLRRVSPEAFNRLDAAVKLLHVERPDMAIAPLFGLQKGKKKATGYTMSVYTSQQLIGAAPSREQPMISGSESAAARGRPSSKSSLVENAKLI